MSIATQLQEAQAFEQRGRLSEAVRGYQRILEREPGNTDALFLLGRACCQMGRFDEGAAFFRKVIALDPDHASAHTLLGRVLAQGGDLQGAIASYDRALVADPRNAMALALKGDALDALGRRADAIEAYDKALAIEPSNIAAWCNRGSALQALGRHAEAVESLKRALALRPDMAEIHFNLANALRELKRYDEAAAHYRRAIALRPRLADAYVNLATALAALSRWEETAQACEQAIKLGAGAYHTLGHALRQLERYDESLASLDKLLATDPDHAQALNEKAWVLYHTGQLQEARALLDRAIALEPDDVNHYLLLTLLKTFRPGDSQAAIALERLRNADLVDQELEARIHFALAKLYGDLDEHEQAFRHLVEANACVRRQIDFDVDIVTAHQARIREVYTPAVMRSKAGQGDPSNRPIFIIGVPRSGTTLVEQILAAHPRVYGAGEIRDFEKAVLAFERLDLANHPEQICDITPDELARLGSAYIASVTAANPAADYFTDKFLGNDVYVGLIHLALPNARFLHVRRNPIDTCMSCFSLQFKDAMNFTYDLRELGLFYRSYETLAAHWRDVLPEGVMLEVQYEDVIEDMEGQARRIVAHCGLAWDDACLAFHKADRPVKTASAVQVRQPIYRSSVGRWRPYRRHLQPLFEALGVSPDEA